MRQYVKPELNVVKFSEKEEVMLSQSFSYNLNPVSGSNDDSSGSGTGLPWI